jgi:hypothetical protein
MIAITYTKITKIKVAKRGTPKKKKIIIIIIIINYHTFVPFGTLILSFIFSNNFSKNGEVAVSSVFAPSTVARPTKKSHL